MATQWHLLCFESEFFSCFLIFQAEKSGCAGDSAASSDSEKQSAAAASSLVAEGVNQTWFTTRDDKHAYQKGGNYASLRHFSWLRAFNAVLNMMKLKIDVTVSALILKTLPSRMLTVLMFVEPGRCVEDDS